MQEPKRSFAIVDSRFLTALDTQGIYNEAFYRELRKEPKRTPGSVNIFYLVRACSPRLLGTIIITHP